MNCRVFLILFLVQLVSSPASTQTSDHLPDPLAENNQQTLSTREQAERLRSIIWPYIIRIEDIRDLNFTISLDSLYQCCIAGQTGDATYEKEVSADVQFFRGSKLTHTDPETARPMIESAIKQFRSLGDSTKTEIGLMQLIWTLSNLGDSTAFAFVRQQAIELLPHLSDPYIVVNVEASLGVGCYDFGMYAEAAAHYFDALKIIDDKRTTEILNSKRDIFHNLGGVYARLGDFNNALLYIRKAIESAKETGQDTLDHYLILARILILKKDFTAALQALKQTENFEFVQANSIGMGQNASSQATCYRQLGLLDSALWYARKSVILLPISINAQNGAAALLELAQCEFALGMDSARQHADSALISLERSKYTTGIVEATALLSKIYKSRGDYLRALEYSEQRFAFQNQIERLQSNRQLAFGEFTRENAAANARREAEVRAKLTQQRNIRYALFAGLAILMFIAVLLYSRFKLNQRTTAALALKNAEIEKAKQRAEASEAFKSRFLANMSHEIRTPLHGIGGFTSLLLHTSLTEKQRQWLSSIHHSTLRLGDVVNDILDISKLEAGEMQLRHIPFSPGQIMMDVHEAIAHRANEKGIDLIINIDQNVPKAVAGDPTRLYQILMNLVGNAVKFTEKGSVTLHLHADSNSTGDQSLTFAIRDTGIGIPADKQSSIFDSFQQASVDTSALYGGTGLGLTIARDLVHLYGGMLHVESEPGKGSTFSFIITLPEADHRELTPIKSSEKLYFTDVLRIVLADDNAFNREIALEALRQHFENSIIYPANNGLEAVHLVRDHDIDLVLMDMQMPVMNGIEATKFIRTQLGDVKKNIPVIALTASATHEEMEKALASGMNRHLGKPFQPVELVVLIADVLQLDKTYTIPESRTDTIFITELQPGASTFDLAFLRDFCEHDEQQVHYFLTKFITQAPIELDNLQDAIMLSNHDAIYKIAHGFKPQLEFVGLKQAGIFMHAIEKGAMDRIPISELSQLLEKVIKCMPNEKLTSSLE